VHFQSSHLLLAMKRCNANHHQCGGEEVEFSSG
jgi:hypothetical protein